MISRNPRLVAVVLAFALVACTGTIGEFPLGNQDAGVTDAGTTDAGTTDAGTADAGTADAGTADAGTTDAGTTDAGTADAGTADAGTTDAGTTACGANLPIQDLIASVEEAANPGTFAIDGDPSTRWSGKGVGASATADLGGIQNICSASVGWYQGNTRTYAFTLSLSTDGTHFTQVTSGQSSGLTTAPETYAFAPTDARYVRLTVNGGSASDWASVTELAASGTVKVAWGFTHPGILVTRGELDFIRAKIAAGEEPWTSQLNKAKNSSRYGRLTWVAKPVPVLQCGNGGSTVDIGCTDAQEDALAAYTLSLIWYHTRDIAYANAAIAILNAWSSTLTQVVYTPGDNNTYQTPLVDAWVSEMFPRSAEILRHTPSGWSTADAARFGTMLNDLMLPLIHKAWSGGGSNWNHSMADGVINIAVYNDDHAVFDAGVALWRSHVPRTLYLKSDGPAPIPPPEHANPDGTWKSGTLATDWFHQPEFGTDRVNGITAETCRDFGHTQMSLASIVYVAETAWIQGLDLYSEEQERIVSSYEFIAGYNNLYAPANNGGLSVTVDNWLCNGTIKVQDLSTWEVAYNHLAVRKGLSMPETATALVRVRQGASYNNLMMAWETLTHDGLGSHGLPRR